MRYRGIVCSIMYLPLAIVLLDRSRLSSASGAQATYTLGWRPRDTRLRASIHQKRKKMSIKGPQISPHG